VTSSRPMESRASAVEARMRQAGWDPVYEGIASMFVGDPFPFLNLGYADPAGSAPPDSADDPHVWERLSEALYDCALDGTSVAGRNVLEVGSGRGGGCAYIAESRAPGAIVGLDRSPSLVEWCSGHYQLASLTFRHGDALRLPFPDDSFDVVVNVESSHCYPSQLDFFREVRRVLRPGGTFAFADVFRDEDGTKLGEIEAALSAAGLRVEQRADIAAGVVEARDRVSSSRAFGERLRRIVPDPDAAEELRQLACFAGTPGYVALVDGERGYWRWIARA
jgi:SAM-dependent methyltransferase